MKLTGGYTFEDGEFVPQGSMSEINARLREMLLVAGSQAMACFYRDRAGRYWRYDEREDYSAELEEVTHDYIVTFPQLDPDRLLKT